MKRSFEAARQKTAVHQTLQVMAQRRRRYVDAVLNVPRRCPVGPALHHEPEHCQPHGVTQRRQLFRVSLELRDHGLLLIFSKQNRKSAVRHLRHGFVACSGCPLDAYIGM
jgi:hypothetical protein